MHQIFNGEYSLARRISHASYPTNLESFSTASEKILPQSVLIENKTCSPLRSD